MSDYVLQDAFSKRRRFASKFFNVPNRQAVMAGYDELTRLIGLDEPLGVGAVAVKVAAAMQGSGWGDASEDARRSVASALVDIMQEADLHVGDDEALDEAWDTLAL